jgi:hypothetical protein
MKSNTVIFPYLKDIADSLTEPMNIFEDETLSDM